jgi:hypothetical protein
VALERATAPAPGAGGPVAGVPAQDRVGVLLLNLGGPETLEDVQPFLYNLFADPDIIRLPEPVRFLQPAIAQLVSSLRAGKSREGYEAIGGGSPLRRITEEQADALAAALRGKGLPAHTYVAMRYWKPFTGERPPRVVVPRPASPVPPRPAPPRPAPPRPAPPRPTPPLTSPPSALSRAVQRKRST